MSTMANDPRLIRDQSGGIIGEIRRRLRQSDLGPLPVIVGLLVIWTVFQIANPNFLSPLNLTNLMLQIAALGTISTGIVLVLLLGEVDLSAGVVSGLSASVMAVLNVKAGVPAPLAVLAGMATGCAVGTLQGWWITKIKVPSFIVTLAGLLAWQGAQLRVLGDTGTVNLRDKFVLGLAGTFFPDWVGWLVGALFIGVYAGSLMLERQRREKAELTVSSMQTIFWQIGSVAVVVLGAMAILNADRGLPSSLVFFIGLVVIFDLILRRTTYGRHIFAVGGNAEAARRASINVDMIRISVFALASTMAAFGGILASSRLLAVNQSSGSGDTLLNAIAAAVIGGTSLFGGRGSVWSALLGALVIGSISNGMDLVGLPSPTKFMITGGVLLAAVTIDALSRRRREASGR